jgi:hypothetical protein
MLAWLARLKLLASCASDAHPIKDVWSWHEPGDDGSAEHRLALRRYASKEAEPPSHARMVSRGFCKKVVLAGFAAEAKAPMMMGHKTELAATVCATILRLAHERAS